MKTITNLLAACLLTAAAFAASPHQCFGPIRFGMDQTAFDKAYGELMETLLKHGNRRGKISTAEVRKYFVTNGARYSAKLTEKDMTTDLNLSWTTDPLVSQVMVRSMSQPTETAWEILRDIAVSKFGPPRKPGAFPAAGALGTTEIVTDTWEFEGVRIELGVSPQGKTSAFLRAKPIG